MIETDRLYIYKANELKDDWWTFFSELVSDADVSSMGWDDKDPKKMTYDELNKKKHRLCNHFNIKGYGQFAVMCKEKRQWIGYCELRQLDNPSDELIHYYNSNGWNYKPDINEVELLYGYTKNSWGKGYATEAAKSVIDFGLNECNIKSISACVNPHNMSSQKILQKLGMKQCGNLMYSKPDDLYFKITH
jgi:RimJ/RimL family protein N-acetyltransferase